MLQGSHGVTNSQTRLSDCPTHVALLLYNAALVSAVQQSESAIGIHIPLPLEPPSHPSRSSQGRVFYFTHGSVCAHQETNTAL